MKREFETFLVWGPEAARSDKTSSSGPVGLCFGDASDEEGVVCKGREKASPRLRNRRWGTVGFIFVSKVYQNHPVGIFGFALTTCDCARRTAVAEKRALPPRWLHLPSRGEVKVPIQYQELLDNVR